MPRLTWRRWRNGRRPFLATVGLARTDGVSTFDLLSIDIADRDSGETGVWWDPTNKALPTVSAVPALRGGARGRDGAADCAVAGPHRQPGL